MKIKFIVKPPAKKEFERELSKFKEEFEIEKELTEREGPKCARNLAKRAIEEGFNRIIFVGGDGLLSEGINGIFETTEGRIPPDFAIGTIPTGAGNNFAKGLGITKDVKKAFEIIRNDKIVSVDLGKVNERYFINCFSIGFDALINRVANDLKEKYRFLPRNLSYLFAAFKEIIIKIPNFEVEMETKGLNYQGKIILAAITNSQSYGAIFKVNPGALISDGSFNLCLIEPVGKIRALFDLYCATRGTHVNLTEVKTFLFSSPLSVFSSEPIPWETDGEVFEPEKEFKISILPRAIKFLTL
ncbi:hypothetical protein AMJ49_01265 [Parcubacteria bacterium DG_74_2]|nr:MAG: hypothetical protein AMJ49_01265 [Parcubacteria bacterium DG_74_2]